VKSDSFKDFILDQLQHLNQLNCRPMFGGYGLYRGKKFFGIIYKGRVYFKTRPSNRTHYVEWGMKPFRPNSKQILKNYFEVPPDILEDSDQLTLWAEQAFQA
jgi:DNA transformation protein